MLSISFRLHNIESTISSWISSLLFSVTASTCYISPFHPRSSCLLFPNHGSIHVSHSEEKWSFTVLLFVYELQKTLFGSCFTYCNHVSLFSGAFGLLLAVVVAQRGVSAAPCLCTAPSGSCTLLFPPRVKVWFGSSMAYATPGSALGWHKWGQGI